MTKKQKKMLIRIVIAAVALIILQFIPFGDSTLMYVLKLVLYLAVYMEIGFDILKKAAKGIKNGQVFDENFLMAVATVGAFALAIYEKSGDYNEGIAVMLFYQIGEWFQGYAVGKSRRNISDLMDIRPDYAMIEQEGELVSVDPDEVPIGSVIVVRVGDKIPIDGVVLEGNTTLNTSALTGESLPREVASGDEVISGCINLTSLIRVRTTREFGESTVSKILELVENSSSNKSRSENFITRFARVYTPTVCISALALAVIPPLVSGLFLGLGFTWSTWIYRALTFLVISCPCALVISIPLTFFAGIGGASNAGVLVKGSNYLEALASTAHVVFDKTGTMTQGVFEVVDIHQNTCSEEELLRYAAIAECTSTHPIAKSLAKAYGKYGKTIDASQAEEISEISGHGVTARIDGHEVCVGNSKLMALRNVQFEKCDVDNGTIVHIAIDGTYAGHIVVSDVLKPHSAEAIANLKSMGITDLVMLTGDAKNVAEAVAAQLGVNKVYAELLPEGKVSKVEELLAAKDRKEILAFVGDGINDAPVLSRADVGIAMGAMGSDAAIEAADIVLMDDDPVKIGKSIRIARKCMRIVYENIYFAIGIKVICLILGALGIANMWLAIFADVGVMVIAVLNAIRALSVKKL